MCVKLLFDQNLSYRLVARLQDHFPDSVHIASLHLDTASDQKVWNYAKEHSYTIVTKDSDFNDLCALYHFPPHIIWLRLGNSRIEIAEAALLHHKARICEMIQDNGAGIIEIT